MRPLHAGSLMALANPLSITIGKPKQAGRFSEFRAMLKHCRPSSDLRAFLPPDTR